MKGKKGQAIMLGIMIFIVVFIAVTQLITPMKNFIIDARDTDKLDCTNSSITFGRKASCILVDTALFYFIGAALAAAAGFLGKKFV